MGDGHGVWSQRSHLAHVPSPTTTPSALTAAAAGPLAVAVSSASNAVSVPATVTVPAGNALTLLWK